MGKFTSMLTVIFNPILVESELAAAIIIKKGVADLSDFKW